LALSVPTTANIVFEGLSEIGFSLPRTLLMVIIVQACFPLSGWLIRGFDMLTPVEDTETK
jgi:hypothetical protein